MIHGNPFDRLGRDARDRAEIVTDRHRRSGSTSRSAMRRDFVLIGMTEEEAERHVDLVTSTTI